MASAGWFFFLSVAFLGLESRLARGGDERGTPVGFNAGMSTGSWPDSVKIEVPPAPNGSAPEVSLVANHHVTQGPLGSGWTLSAGSVIERRSFYGGVPNFRSDVYYLDGVEMRKTAGGPPATWSPMTVDGSVFTYNSTNNTWTRKNKGKTWTYGSTSGTNATRLLTDSGVVPLPTGGNCVTSLCKTSAWFVSKIVDPHGNTLNFTYENPTIPAGTLATRYPWLTSGQYLLKTITYGTIGTLSVNFTYKDRPDTRFVVEGGRKTLQLKRLRSITTKTSKFSTAAAFSRYTIQYEDETSESELGAGHCVGVASLNAAPEQSLIRKIVQIGTGTAAAPLPQRALRCIASNHEALSWESTAEVISTITAPAAGTNASEESVLPLTANLNRDALTDLIVIGLKTDSATGNVTGNIRTYIATPILPARFMTAQSGGPQGAAALLWQNKLQSRLNNRFLQARKAWALVDTDADLTPELLWEGTGGVIKIDSLSDDALTFSTTSTSLTPCQLKYGSFVNIDGNKYFDLVVHPRCDNGTKWLRDLGAGGAVTLAVPLELANTEWSNILSTACVSTHGAVTPPGSFNPDWTAGYLPQYYIGDHARFGDFNGDGLADIAYALHACWQETTTDDSSTTDFNESNWEPLIGSTYSRIWFGDGYGNFTDSKLSAGPPVTFDLDTVDTTNSPSVAHQNRTLSGMLAPADLDNNGLPELLMSAVFSEGAGTIASKYRGLVSGWSGSSVPSVLAPDIATGSAAQAWGTAIPGMEYLSGGAPCHERSATAAFEDFDGDGFIDVLKFDLNHETTLGGIPLPSACGQFFRGWCMTLRSSARKTSEGRMTGVTGADGGLTTLVWDFSGNPSTQWNRNLAINKEVVKKVTGAEGQVTFRYTGAFWTGEIATPFAEVTTLNERGASEQFGYVTAPWAGGQPSYAARYRVDGTLEHVSVFIYGRINNQGQYEYNPLTPYFNPLFRQCEYEIGNANGQGLQTVTVSGLIDDCYAYVGEPVVPGAEVPWWSIDPNNIPEALGQTGGNISPGGLTEYQNSFSPYNAEIYTTITQAQAWDYKLQEAASHTTLPFLRWTVPSALTGLIPDGESAQDSYTYPVENAVSTSVVELVQDFHWDTGIQKFLKEYNYRDTTTLADNQIRIVTSNQPDSTGYWYQVTKEEITDGLDQSLSVTKYSDFATPALYTARYIDVCGKNGTLCRAHQYTLSAGDIITHVGPDGTESWMRNVCGQATQYSDPELRVRTTTITGCREMVSRFEGSTTTYLRDGLGRQTKATVVPGGGGPTVVTDLYYDDSFSDEDTDYNEPHFAKKRTEGTSGKVSLTYVDGFGRLTKQVECQSGTPSGTSGVLASVGCVAGTERTTNWNLIGSDGLLKVSTEPFEGAETPTTAGMAHDGAGRTIVSLTPAHTAGVGWVQTKRTRGADWTQVGDPMGLVTRNTSSTLKRETSLGGKRRLTEIFDVGGRLVESTAADGLKTTFAYDNIGNLSQITRPSETCIDKNGASVTCTWLQEFKNYDGAGRARTVVALDGLVTKFTFDAIGRVLTTNVGTPTDDFTQVESRVYTDAIGTTMAKVDVTDENGVVSTTTVDGLGRPLSVKVLGMKASTVYGANGLPATATDINGRVTTFTYDNLERLIQVKKPGNVIINYDVDGAGRLLSMTDADGVMVSNEFAYSGQVLRMLRNGVWMESETVYDAGGRPQEVLRNGIRSTFGYMSGLGLLSTVERIDDSRNTQDTTNFYYDSGDRLVEAERVPQSGSSVSTMFDYDLWGRTVSRTNATPATWFTSRDVMGRVRFQTDPSGVSLETKYDLRGRVSKQEFPGGWRTTSYAANQSFNGIPNLWRMNSTVDSGVSSVYVDSLGRELATVDPTGIVTISTWTGADLMTAATRHLVGAGPTMTADLNRQDLTYDTAGRLKTQVGPYFPADLVATHDKTTFNYTAAGRLLSNVAMDQTTTFSYEQGRLKSETFDNQVRTYFYDDAEAPWPTDMELSGGGSIRSTSFTRDAVGRILSETITAPGQKTVVNEQSKFTVLGAPQFQQRKVDNAVETTTNWTYDVAGRPLTRAVDPPGVDVLKTAWAWNPNGSLQKVTTPSNKQIAYTYSATTGLLDRVYNPVGGTDYSQVVARNGAGQVTEYTVAPDSTTRTLSYDLAGRPLTRSTVGGGISLSWVNKYNRLGQLDTETYTNNAATVWSNTFLYNGRGRLFDEFRGATGQRFFYTWTPGGNLTRVDQEAVPSGAVTALTTAKYDSTYKQKLETVDGATISYDAWQEIMTDQHGNIFTYTADGEVRTVKGPTGPLVEIQRDSAGMPVAYVEGGVVPRLASWDLNPGAMPLEVRQSTNVPRTYINGVVGQVGVLNRGVFASGEQDTQGSHLREGTAVLNQATAFGASVIAPTGSDERFLFASLETVKGAAGGIHLARHRAYDSETGRFKSPDPIGLEGGNHRFLYANGDPLGYSDVLGYLADPIDPTPSCLVPPTTTTIHFPNPYTVDPMTIVIDNPITPNAVMGSGSGTYAGDNHPDQYTQAEMNAHSQEAYDKQHDDGGTYQADWRIGPKIIKKAKGSEDDQSSGGDRAGDDYYDNDGLVDAGGSGAGQLVSDGHGGYKDLYTGEHVEVADLKASKEWTGWSPIPPETIDNQTEKEMAEASPSEVTEAREAAPEATTEPSSGVKFDVNIDASNFGTTVSEHIGGADLNDYYNSLPTEQQAAFDTARDRPLGGSGFLSGFNEIFLPYLMADLRAPWTVSRWAIQSITHRADSYYKLSDAASASVSRFMSQPNVTQGMSAIDDILIFGGLIGALRSGVVGGVRATVAAETKGASATGQILPASAPRVLSPIGLSSRELGRLSDEAAAAVARTDPRFGGFVGEQVDWRLTTSDGHLLHGRADAVVRWGPDGRPTVLDGKFGANPSTTYAQTWGYPEMQTGTSPWFGKPGLGSPFNGSSGADVWFVSNAPGNVLAPPVVWHSAGNTLRILIPMGP